MTYEQWKSAVDSQCVKISGMSTDDIPDFNYSKAYDTHRDPASTARAALKAAKSY